MDGNQKLNINPLTLPNVKCETCGGIFFENVTIIKRVSGLLVGSTQDEMIPMETYVCSECGHMNKEFNILGDEQ